MKLKQLEGGKIVEIVAGKYNVSSRRFRPFSILSRPLFGAPFVRPERPPLLCKAPARSTCQARGPLTFKSTLHFCFCPRAGAKRCLAVSESGRVRVFFPPITLFGLFEFVLFFCRFLCVSCVCATKKRCDQIERVFFSHTRRVAFVILYRWEFLSEILLDSPCTL